MWKKTIYFLVLATIFAVPLSPFGKSLFFYLLVLLFLLRLTYLYWKKADLAERFFIAIGWVYLLELIKFRDFPSWWKSFSGKYLIVFLFYLFLKYVYNNLSYFSEKKKFFQWILILFVLTAVINSLIVLWEHQIISSDDFSKWKHIKKYGLSLQVLWGWRTPMKSGACLQATGRWGNPIQYGGHLMLAILIVIFWWQRESNWKLKYKIGVFFFFLLLISFFFLNLYWTLSRNVLIILLVDFFLLLLWDRKVLKLLLFLGMIGGIIYLALMKKTDFASKMFRSKNHKLYQNLKTQKDRERDFVLGKAIYYLKDKHYWWGIGPGRLDKLYSGPNPFNREYDTSHNIYLQYWLELGILGFFSWLFFLFGWLIKNILFWKRFWLSREKHYDYFKVYFAQLVFFSFVWCWGEIFKQSWDYLFIDSGYSFMFWTIVFVNLYSIETFYLLQKAK